MRFLKFQNFPEFKNKSKFPECVATLIQKFTHNNLNLKQNIR